MRFMASASARLRGRGSVTNRLASVTPSQAAGLLTTSVVLKPHMHRSGGGSRRWIKALMADGLAKSPHVLAAPASEQPGSSSGL